jgi:hypothetical protein
MSFYSLEMMSRQMTGSQPQKDEPPHPQARCKATTITQPSCLDATTQAIEFNSLLLTASTFSPPKISKLSLNASSQNSTELTQSHTLHELYEGLTSWRQFSRIVADGLVLQDGQKDDSTDPGKSYFNK